MDYVAYIRVYLRDHKDIKDAEKELCELLKDCDFALDGLYDLCVCIADALG